MTGPADERLDPDDLKNLPDDLRESIEDEQDPSYGDETQRNQVIETEEGLEQTSLAEPELEDEDKPPPPPPRKHPGV